MSSWKRHVHAFVSHSSFFCPGANKGPNKGMNPALSKSMDNLLDNLTKRPFITGRNRNAHVLCSSYQITDKQRTEETAHYCTFTEKTPRPQIVRYALDTKNPNEDLTTRVTGSSSSRWKSSCITVLWFWIYVKVSRRMICFKKKCLN